MRLHADSRRATTVVESAVVYPLTFFFTLCFIVGVMGIFRYQEVATLSRETSRYAAVHGTEYATTAGVTAPTPAEIYTNVIVPKAIALDPAQLTYSITYNKTNHPYYTKIVNGDVIPVYNTVTVVVTYNWIPETFLGPITLTSSSSMQMSY
jgi:hypothetical protein